MIDQLIDQFSFEIDILFQVFSGHPIYQNIIAFMFKWFL